MMKKKILKIPVFWDLHIHGVAGIDFMHASHSQMIQACEILGKHGIGAFSPTLLTSNMELLTKACKAWGEFLTSYKNSDTELFFSPTAAIPVGLHLEGPFLNPDMSGAHPKSNLKTPSVKIFETLEKSSKQNIAIITIAPELKNANKLISAFSKKGIRSQIGHTIAQNNEITAAIKAGASGVTHLYNAMKIHHRLPGVLPFLERNELTSEIITDGIHLNIEFTKFLIDSLPNSLYSVTDACSALGSKKNDSITLGDLKLIKNNKIAMIKATNVLAGGATWMVDHPALFKKYFNNIEFFKLFYQIPASLFPNISKKLKYRKNLFDSNSWKFIGSIHEKFYSNP